MHRDHKVLDAYVSEPFYFTFVFSMSTLSGGEANMRNEYVWWTSRTNCKPMDCQRSAHEHIYIVLLGGGGDGLCGILEGIPNGGSTRVLTCKMSVSRYGGIWQPFQPSSRLCLELDWNEARTLSTVVTYICCNTYDSRSAHFNDILQRDWGRR